MAEDHKPGSKEQRMLMLAIAELRRIADQLETLLTEEKPDEVPDT